MLRLTRKKKKKKKRERERKREKKDSYPVRYDQEEDIDAGEDVELGLSVSEGVPEWSTGKVRSPR